MYLSLEGAYSQIVIPNVHYYYRTKDILCQKNYPIHFCIY